MKERLYRVLKPGIRQLVDGEFRRPAPGALINVSEEGAELLLREGFVELANKPAAPGTNPEDGGIVSAPAGGVPAQLHGEEAIVPISAIRDALAAAGVPPGELPTPIEIRIEGKVSDAMEAVAAAFVPSVPPAEPTEIPTSDLTPLDETPGTIATVSGQKAAVVIDKADSVEELDRLEAAERASQRHPGGRTGVLRAIAARRQELTANQAPKE
jgi:hypothetical protein